ncbi:MAG TPA: septal ring lytic transglycosylase RlpA family protein [Roseiarcus sp.]|nr:septal ring lytic transglycosylase RlpA family protein [Roseiarcus sp.]
MKPILLALLLAATASAEAKAQSVGQASYYSHPRYRGLIAAHRTFPLGTHVRVVNLNNGRAATVVIVDRGPFIRSRIIDVSTSAAEILGFRRAGVARVRLEVVNK